MLIKGLQLLNWLSRHQKSRQTKQCYISLVAGSSATHILYLQYILIMELKSNLFAKSKIHKEFNLKYDFPQWWCYKGA